MTTLHEYITARMDTPFRWGEHDCVTFAVGWMELRSGNDYLSAYRPWTTAPEAARMVRRNGGLIKLFGKHFRRIHPNLANDGDLAIHNGTAYLFSGGNIVASGESGLVFNRREVAECAWSL